MPKVVAIAWASDMMTMNDNDWLMIYDWWLRVSAIKCIFLDVYVSTEKEFCQEVILCRLGFYNNTVHYTTVDEMCTGINSIMHSPYVIIEW